MRRGAQARGLAEGRGLAGGLRSGKRSPGMGRNPFEDPAAASAGADAAAIAASATPAACPLCASTASRMLFHKHGYQFRRCRSCRLVRIHPLPSAEGLARIYEASYAGGAYASFAGATEVRAATARARVAAIRPHIGPGPWLDVGCSTGALLTALGDAGFDAEGIELSAEAVATARARGLAATRISAELFIPERRFACVTAFDLVEHLIDPNEFLTRVRDWLLPGGRLAITVPDIASPVARLMGRHWHYYAPPVHVTYFDRDTIERLLARHGLHTLSISHSPKILTATYVLDQLDILSPAIGRVLSPLRKLLPRGLRDRPLHFPVGEILVVATA